jgi:cell division protein FtsB
MPPTRRNKAARHRLLLALAAGVLMVLLLLFGTGRYGWISMIRLNRQERELQRSILVNLARNAILSHEIRRLQNDRFYLESKAREELGLVRPGEISYRILPADSGKKKP